MRRVYNTGMVPMRHSTIFRSRWMALLWAAGIIWFAYDFAAPANADDNASANDDAAVAAALDS